MNLAQECYYSDYQNSGIPKKKKKWKEELFSQKEEIFSF